MRSRKGQRSSRRKRILTLTARVNVMILDRKQASVMGFLSAVSPPAEGTRLQQNDVAIFVEREDFGKGTLYIAER